jgi:hypothetical protein
MGTVSAVKNGEAKDKCIYSTFKNTIAESHSGSMNYGPDIALRKLPVLMNSRDTKKYGRRPSCIRRRSFLH